MGKAMMGTGEAEGEDRAVQAAEKAIANPLLDEISLEGARGVLINITGGYDLTLFELDEAANKIREKVDPEANIIVGSTLDTSMEGKMRVSVVATGIDARDMRSELPLPRRSMAQPLKQQVSAETPAAAKPAPRVEPVATPVAARAAAPVQVHAEEPTLFDEDEFEAPRNTSFEDDDFEAQLTAQLADEEDESDLPPPAYKPRAEPPMTRDAESFVAPRAPAPGTPSAEAMQRLQAAVNKVPSAAPQRAATPPTGRSGEAGEKPRFGINSLINRMTGTGHEAAQPTRQQPQLRGYHEDAEADPEQERIEIPAFLRRQAN
jgi:cell division protein FtsZ